MVISLLEPIKPGQEWFWSAAWQQAEKEVEEDPAPDEGQLLALVDALHEGTLNGKQKQTLQALREGIMARARRWELVDKVELGC